ncbi:trimeric intracellular cation channel family protein [Candidatus Nitrosotenuis chungbukensis]|uniref:trimeric intracellular cation channel family protein n=1 Tax=Candidatus Nitrosotenuis chungbukensis TaxID=1353246 RepID=UPI002672A497|nr:trimeric intracellular cation channel family protein [Candidatus Nitrosotenuis chungbukensis]WKT58825.1 trimeric intracellular cation channel family protein [Candidatus Nitrosotenuis chungbukensis]
MPDISFAFLIYVFDLFGTMAFAVTGAFKAIEHKSDIVGIIILSVITGVAGGTIRDIIIGKFPPNSISDPSYVIVSVASAVALFFLYPHLKKHWNVFLKFDAIGLGVFSITGATFAYSIFGLNFLAMAFAGILSAVGGGILRDVFVNEVPIIFVKEPYAAASFVGVVVFFLLLVGGTPLYIASITGIVIITSLRLVAMKYNWNLPRAREK